ncbi:MAG TPA: TetR/AcrR family transcriptional regulator [Euryarchaeota archaeon]|nr:TetR/AcrR family transcriptional regulator [Euryarchaeota archaeon]
MDGIVDQYCIGFGNYWGSYGTSQKIFKYFDYKLIDRRSVGNRFGCGPVEHRIKKHEERRTEIIETAVELFAQHGYDETSVNMIIDRIGIAKGTFYHYFSSKDELLEEIVDLMVEKVEGGVDEISGRDDMNALEKMAELTRFFRTIGIGWERISEFLHEERNAHWHLKLEKKLLPSLIDSYRRIIEQGVREGIFDVELPRETAVALLGAINALTEGKHDHVNRGLADPLMARAVIDVSERLLGMRKGAMMESYEKELRE